MRPGNDQIIDEWLIIIIFEEESNIIQEMKKCFLVIALSLSALFMHAQVDTTRVLCVGNSFTYYFDSHLKLAEIALSQGHYIDMTAAYVGGYTFNRHLNDLKTIGAIEQFTKPYDCVFLQNQSQVHALYAQNPKQHKLQKKDAVELVARVRQYSPDARIWLESTWSYPAGNCGGFGTEAEFNRLMVKGTWMLAKAAHTAVSPIGEAFRISREERPDIDLFSKDKKHQSAFGTYLKSCVNYLMIFGGRFNGDASDCGLDPDSCAFLRSVAERVVASTKR